MRTFALSFPLRRFFPKIDSHEHKGLHRRRMFGILDWLSYFSSLSLRFPFCVSEVRDTRTLAETCGWNYTSLRLTLDRTIFVVSPSAASMNDEHSKDTYLLTPRSSQNPVLNPLLFDCSHRSLQPNGTRTDHTCPKGAHSYIQVPHATFIQL